MSIENKINQLENELAKISLPANTTLKQLTDKTLTGNVAPFATTLAAAIIDELGKQDSAFSVLFKTLFEAFDTSSSTAKGKVGSPGKSSSTENILESSRQTWEWLSTTTPFEQILNLVRSMGYFAAISFGEMNTLREKASQEANRINRPNLLDPGTLVHQYYREPENQAVIKQILTLHGLPDQQIDSLIRMNASFPSASDLIAFAVREVFDPKSVAKFQLSSDMPQDFIKEAKLAGLDPKYAAMYWQAHWKLPSVNQVFEMSHRGAIDESDVDLLLKANDIMPGFRNAMKAIAHSRFTRVDIRRVYHAGLRSEDWVLQKYMELGYNEEDAGTQTELVVQEYNEQNKDFNTTQVLGLYEEKFYNTEQTKHELIELGHPNENATLLIQKRDIEIAERIEKKLTGKIKSNYIKGANTFKETREQLIKIGMSAETIESYLFDWDIDKTATQKVFTTAQIKKLLKAEIITNNDAMTYLVLQNWPEDKAEKLILLWGFDDDDE